MINELMTRGHHRVDLGSLGSFGSLALDDDQPTEMTTIPPHGSPWQASKKARPKAGKVYGDSPMR